jgi:hypothetical protein
MPYKPVRASKQTELLSLGSIRVARSLTDLGFMAKNRLSVPPVVWLRNLVPVAPSLRVMLLRAYLDNTSVF